MLTGVSQCVSWVEEGGGGRALLLLLPVSSERSDLSRGRSGPAGLWREVLVPGRSRTGGSAAQNHELKVCLSRTAVLLAAAPGGCGASPEADLLKSAKDLR